MKVKIVVYVPPENADDVRLALGAAGAGQIGEYTFCSFSTIGVGRYTPSPNARPHIGNPGRPKQTEEERIEVICERTKAKEAIKLMKQAHPYEEVAFNITAIIDESEL